MKSISEVAKEQKEKWNGLEIIVAAISRKRELAANPQVVPEVKDAECGMKINPWTSSSFHFQQNGKIYKKCAERCDQKLNVEKKATEGHTVYRYGNSQLDVSPSVQRNKKEKSTNFPEVDSTEVWPSDKLNCTKHPASKNVEITASPSTISFSNEVVIETCRQNNNLKMTHVKSSEKLRPGDTNIKHTAKELINLLTNNRNSKHNNCHWHQDGDSYVYVKENERFKIHRETGKVTCYQSHPVKSTFRYEKPISTEHMQKLERKLLIPLSCCITSQSLCKTFLKYNSINKLAKKKTLPLQRSAIVLKKFVGNSHRNSRDRRRTSTQFIICSTKFGSFIERYLSDVHVDHNYMKRYLKRHSKAEEEKLLLVLKNSMQPECLLDETRLGVLKSSISYIQCLEQKLKEKLGIVPQSISEDRSEGNQSEITIKSTITPASHLREDDVSIIHDHLPTSFVFPSFHRLTDLNAEMSNYKEDINTLFDLSSQNFEEHLFQNLDEFNSVESVDYVNSTNNKDCDNPPFQGFFVNDDFSILKEDKQQTKDDVLRTDYMADSESTISCSSDGLCRMDDGCSLKFTVDDSNDRNNNLTVWNVKSVDMHHLTDNGLMQCPNNVNSVDVNLRCTDDITMQCTDNDVMLRLNYTDVNLNSLSKEDDVVSDDSPVRTTSWFMNEDVWRISKEDSVKTNNGGTLFSPSLLNSFHNDFQSSSP